MSNKAYNLKMTVNTVETPTDTAGKTFLRANVTAMIGGKPANRTLMAQGKAVEAIQAVMVAGQDTAVRCLFDNVENEDGSKGGQFLVAVGLPAEKKAA